MENNDNLLKKILADHEIQKGKEGREKAEDCRKSEQLQELNSAERLRDSPEMAFCEGQWVKHALGEQAEKGCWGWLQVLFWQLTSAVKRNSSRK